MKRSFKIIWLLPTLLAPITSIPLLVTSCGERMIWNSFKVNDIVKLSLNDGSMVYGFINEIVNDDSFKINGLLYQMVDVQNMELFPFKIEDKIQINQSEYGILTNISPEGLQINNLKTYSWDIIKTINPLSFNVGDFVMVSDSYYGIVDEINTNSLTLTLNNNKKTCLWNDITSIKLADNFTYSIGNYVNVIKADNITYYGSISNVDPNCLNLMINNVNNVIYWQEIAGINLSKKFPFNMGEYVKVTSTFGLYEGDIVAITPTGLKLKINSINTNIQINWGYITNITKLESLERFKIGDYVTVKTASNVVYYGSILKNENEYITLTLNDKNFTILKKDIFEIKLSNQFSFRLNDYVKVASTFNSTWWGNIVGIDPQNLEIKVTHANVNVSNVSINWGYISEIKFSKIIKLGDYVTAKTFSSDLVYYGCITNINSTYLVLTLNNENLSLSWSEIKDFELSKKFPFSKGEYIKVVGTFGNTWIGYITIYTNPKNLHLNTSVGSFTINWSAINTISFYK